MIKAVFFDIDGTLISWKTKRIPDSVYTLCEHLRKKGILCFVATGRSSFEIAEANLLGTLSFDGYLLNNGQLAVDELGQAYFEVPVDREDLESLLLWLEETGQPCWMVSRTMSRINRIDERVRKAMTDIHTPIPAVGDLRKMAEGTIYKFALYLKPEELPMERLPHCAQTQWHAFAHDLFSIQGGKRMAFLATLEHYGLHASECMAFGDSDNDIGLLQAAGIGVAMKEATPGAKAAADYITLDCEEDGILYALRHFSVL